MLARITLFLSCAGLFFGFALAQATFFSSRIRIKWSLVSLFSAGGFLFLSLAVLSGMLPGLLGVWAPELAFSPSSGVLPMTDFQESGRLIWVAVGSFLIGGMGFRFKKAVGIPVLFLCLFFFLSLRSGLMPLFPVSENESFALFRILSADRERVILEVVEPVEWERVVRVSLPGTGDPENGTPGEDGIGRQNRIALVSDMLLPDPILFFFPASGYVNNIAFSGEATPGDDDHVPSFRFSRWSALGIMSRSGMLTAKRVKSDLFHPEILTRYTVCFKQGVIGTKPHPEWKQ